MFWLGGFNLLQAAAAGHNGAGGAVVTVLTRGHVNAVIARFFVLGHNGSVQQIFLVIFQRDSGQGVAVLTVVGDGELVLYRVLCVAKGCLGLRQGVGARRKVGQAVADLLGFFILTRALDGLLRLDLHLAAQQFFQQAGRLQGCSKLGLFQFLVFHVTELMDQDLVGAGGVYSHQAGCNHGIIAFGTAADLFGVLLLHEADIADPGVTIGPDSILFEGVGDGALGVLRLQGQALRSLPAHSALGGGIVGGFYLIAHKLAKQREGFCVLVCLGRFADRGVA